VNHRTPTSLGNMMNILVNESLGMRDYVRIGMPDDLMLNMLNALNDPVDKNDGIYKGKRIFPPDGLGVEESTIINQKVVKKRKEIVKKEDLNTCSAIITVMQNGHGDKNVNGAIIYYGEERAEGQFGHYVSLWQDCTNHWHFYDSLLTRVYTAPTPEVLTTLLKANGIVNMLYSPEKFIHAFALPIDERERKAACLKAYNNLQSIVSSSLLFYGMPTLITIQQQQVQNINTIYGLPLTVAVQPGSGEQTNNYNTRSRTRIKRRVID